MMNRMIGGNAASLLKEGAKLTEKDEAIVRNIQACRELTEKIRTSMGPLGMSKMVIDRHDKIYVTSDAATIVKELEIEHPAAKILVYASKRQEEEVGDGTNWVISFGGQLLQGAQQLLDMGLHASDIVSGYEQAGKFALEALEKISLPRAPPECTDIANAEHVKWLLHPVINTKQYGCADLLADLVSKACVGVCPKTARNFNVDHVRSVKVLGGGVMDSYVVPGFAIAKAVAGNVAHVKDAKIALFAGGLDLTKTEGKGTVNVTTAKELEEYSETEERELETLVKGIAESGANVVVSGQSLNDMALHFVEKYKMLAIVVQSKFDMRRICVASGATPLVRVGKPLPEELGYLDEVSMEEISSTNITFFKSNPKESKLSTIVIRGATQNVLDDVERAIDDAVNVFKCITRGTDVVPGAGSTEIELAKVIRQQSQKLPGLEQYAFAKFAEALEFVPRTLAETAGMDETEAISALNTFHEDPEKADFGVDIENEGYASAADTGVWDLKITKHWALKLSTDAVATILRVDQIIMAKPAGGPKIPKGQMAS